MPEPQYDDGGAIASTGAGGAADLAMSEGETLEKSPGGPQGTGPSGKPRSLWSDACANCAATPSSSSPGSSSSSWSSSPSGRR